MSLLSRSCSVAVVARWSNFLQRPGYNVRQRGLFSTLTSEDAGQRASEMAAALRQGKQVEGDGVHRKKIETLLSHAGIEEGRHDSPQAPPLHVATTYTRPADGIYKEGDFKYARMDNPTRLQLEKTIFDLECINLPVSQSREGSTHTPTSSLALASGLMAVTTILLAHSSPITVIIPDDMYHGASGLLFDVFATHSNVRTVQVDMSQTSSVVDAISNIAKEHSITANGEEQQRQSIIVWMESPSNPKCQIVDIRSICNAVQQIQEDEMTHPYLTCTTVVDGTMSSPVLTRSLELGADISLHSATKYLGGHSDALLGVLTPSPITRRGRELGPVLQNVQMLAGGVASPWDSWLVLRGLRTLVVRVQQQCQTALQLARHFEDEMQRQPSSCPCGLIRAVHYPGLTTHPQHDVARRQMGGMYGGVLSVELKDEVSAMAFAGALQTIHRATSLGGTETLIEHRASVEPPERRVSPPGLLRISVGLEDPDDLIRDIDMALKITAEICK